VLWNRIPELILVPESRYDLSAVSLSYSLTEIFRYFAHNFCTLAQFFRILSVHLFMQGINSYRTIYFLGSTKFFFFSSKDDASALSASKLGKENQAASSACTEEEAADKVIPDSSQLGEASDSSARTPRRVRSEAPGAKAATLSSALTGDDQGVEVRTGTLGDKEPATKRASRQVFLTTNNTRSSLKDSEAKVEENRVQLEDTEREEERIKQVQQESSVVEPEPEP
jgi:hypothetical protein